jgi:hypothetical protein
MGQIWPVNDHQSSFLISDLHAGFGHVREIAIAQDRSTQTKDADSD